MTDETDPNNQALLMSAVFGDLPPPSVPPTMPSAPQAVPTSDIMAGFMNIDRASQPQGPDLWPDIQNGSGSNSFYDPPPYAISRSQPGLLNPDVAAQAQNGMLDTRQVGYVPPEFGRGTGFTYNGQELFLPQFWQDPRGGLFPESRITPSNMLPFMRDLVGPAVVRQALVGRDPGSAAARWSVRYAPPVENIGVSMTGVGGQSWLGSTFRDPWGRLIGSNDRSWNM